ncbi:MAG: TrkH family potassium uptake protein [Actinobacteria bacterium]|nr:MAG: TrkH family potassium uptake protein [Actinomycetota bacterium]
MVVVAFILFISVGTALLWLPWASDGGANIGFENALFMSTSAATVTGLATVPMSDFSLFGELVILALIQIGGFGIMTIGSLVALIASNRLGLRQRMLAQTEIGAVNIGELRTLIAAIARITLGVEGALALILFVRFWQGGYEEGPVSAAYSAIFHSVASFNNAGISLYSDSLTRFATDPVVVLSISGAFIIGGLGFPVLVELWRRERHRRETGSTARIPWSIHLKITLWATAGLLVIGPLVVLIFEWSNPATLGPLDLGDKVLSGWFQGVTPRTAGFSTLNVGGMNEPTLLVISILMFIGAGPASTSGGIKVTTFAILGLVLWSEVRGNTDINVFKRRLPERLVRQALAIVMISFSFVVATTLTLMALDDLQLTPAMFEAASAFGTVGLSTGVTGTLGGFGHAILIVVMLAGRVGPITFVTAWALRDRARVYRYPEERPIIG